jgi:sugar lactone lactonase YvrE
VIIKSFAVDGKGSLYLLDVHGSRVLVLGPDGTFAREVQVPSTAGFVSDIAVSANNTVLLVDSVQAAVYAADLAAKAFTPLVAGDRAALGFPTAIATDSEGMIYLLDRNGGSVVLLRPNGAIVGRRLSRGWKEGFLNYPSQLCITDKGDLFIADRNSSRVQMFRIAR